MRMVAVSMCIYVYAHNDSSMLGKTHLDFYQRSCSYNRTNCLIGAKHSRPDMVRLTATTVHAFIEFIIKIGLSRIQLNCIYIVSTYDLILLDVFMLLVSHPAINSRKVF